MHFFFYLFHVQRLPPPIYLSIFVDIWVGFIYFCIIKIIIRLNV